MRKVTITTFLSLDGVMQGPGGPDEDRSGGFEHGGWMVPYAAEDSGRMVTEWIGQASAFLLGRVTYDIFAAYWPKVTDPNHSIAQALNKLPKYVASTTTTKAEWQNSTVIRGDVVDAVRALKREGTGQIQVHGSGGLAQTLMKNDLIDVYRLWWIPVIIGSGKRLFASGTVPAALKLQSSETTSTGVVVQTYERAGSLRHGTFSLTGNTNTKQLFED